MNHRERSRESMRLRRMDAADGIPHVLHVRRLAFEPLERWAASKGMTLWEHMGTPAAVRYRSEGIPAGTADVAACRLGVHPATIWGSEWWEAIADAS